MSPETLVWIKAFHVFGVLMWMGTMIGLCHIMVAHANADLGARPSFHALERNMGRAMDVGATLAMVFGVIMLLKVPGLMKAGYMHAKLALVILAILSTHGFLRVKIRKYREGKVVPLPGFLAPLLSLVALGVIILVFVKPF
jgi:protoporphyrinogen IX oxidase